MVGNSFLTKQSSAMPEKELAENPMVCKVHARRHLDLHVTSQKAIICIAARRAEHNQAQVQAQAAIQAAKAFTAAA